MVELLSHAESTAHVCSGVAILAPLNGGQCNSNWTRTGQWGGACPIPMHFDRSMKIQHRSLSRSIPLRYGHRHLLQWTNNRRTGISLDRHVTTVVI